MQGHLRVLNGGTWPSFCFQKFSRWYKPQDGPSLFLICGEFGSDIFFLFFFTFTDYRSLAESFE